MSTTHTNLILAGDIGGTKVNLGIFRAGKTKPLTVIRPETFLSRSAPDLETHIKQFLDRHHIAKAIKSACFGLAGPVIKGRAKATNLPWVVSETNLQKRFGWPKVSLINDLVATALAIPLLKSTALLALNRARVDRQGHLAVVAPGTGLGKALVAVGTNQMVPVASEGGHVGFAPANQAQVRLWRYLHQRFDRVSQERVLSGIGLVNIYAWLRDVEAMEPAPAVEHALETAEYNAAPMITEKALAHQDSICQRALTVFVEIFGAIAGDWALGTMARGGVYLGGGIPPKILPVLRTGDFMAAFCAKGRFSEVVASMPVRVILNDRAALLGAARCALMH